MVFEKGAVTTSPAITIQVVRVIQKRQKWPTVAKLHDAERRIIEPEGCRPVIAHVQKANQQHADTPTVADHGNRIAVLVPGPDVGDCRAHPGVEGPVRFGLGHLYPLEAMVEVVPE